MSRRRQIAMLAPLPILLLAAGCELGPKLSEQTGIRGAGLAQVTDPSNVREASAIPAPPFPLPPDDGGPRMQGQNIQVLGNLSTDQFTHFMSSMSLWVAGDATNCGFCHNVENMADDSNYRMQVARRMIQMTWALNSQWSNHTGQTGVTCYTCHRGNNVPEYVWSQEVPGNEQSIRGQRRGQNAPSAAIGYASLPYGVFGQYFGGNPEAVRVASDSPYPGRNPAGTRAAEDSYAIMMHLSQSLGVNCTYCHNSQSFRSWSLSRAQRATAWYGIRMVRDTNQNYIHPLAVAGVLPANRRGPAGDALQVNCLTCHQGQAKPLGGVPMINDYPYLRPSGARVAAPAALPQPAPGDDAPAALEQPGAMTGRIDPPNAPGGNTQVPAQ